MKRYVLLLFFLTYTISTYAGNEIDSLLRVLDETINDKIDYSKRKENRIDSLKLVLSNTSDKRQQYRISHKLFDEYANYNMDSALQVANNRLELAIEMQDTDYIHLANMNIAAIMGIMGMYKESLDILNNIPRHKLAKKQESYYYHLYHSIYTLISENSYSKKEKEFYEKLIYQYKDSLLLVINPNTLSYHLVENGKLVKMGEYEKALSIMLQSYEEIKDNDSQLGMLSYGLADIYRKIGNKPLEKKYLIISAIADMRMGVKEYIALHKLAILLYKEGDVDRAYTYIKCSMEDAIYCKARYRTLEISEMLPIIISAYDIKMKQERDRLFGSLILISFLSIVLIVSIIYIYKQLKKLSAARKSMKGMNLNLKEMNENLNDLNKQLLESNHVKEEYIGSVFNLCSTYIDKLEAYRININRKLKAGQIDEASKITNSSSLVVDELKEFFRNFDIIFLNIYPNFVEEFNALLSEDEQIIPKAGDILTPELRVFALVRLGITDSSKIASFLHYSPQTVYNYKLKVRNKIQVSKDQFSIALQQIGK